MMGGLYLLAERDAANGVRAAANFGLHHSWDITTGQMRDHHAAACMSKATAARALVTRACLMSVDPVLHR